MSGWSLLAPRRFARLIASDAMNIVRDPMLLLAAVMSLVPAVAFYFGRLPMDEAALGTFGIESFSRYVAPFVLLIPALLVGWVTGFLLLEDRDDGPLLAIDVTPVGKAGFLGYRVAVSAVVAALITLYASPLVIPERGWSVAMVMAMMVAGEAVIAAVVLPAIARNKVEGLALSKVINLASIVPLLAILPSPWRYFAGVLPGFWIGELLDLSGEATMPLAAIVILGLGIHAAAIFLLFRLLGRRQG